MSYSILSPHSIAVIADSLQGVRGEKPSDIKKLTECIQRISQLAIDFPQIKELDLNPTVVFEEGKGYKVVDVRIGLS
jgi:4-hydroxybutyryl-CoA synthetase (ADP-forming)